MISIEQLNKLRGANVRVTSAGSSSSALTGTLRVVDHEIPVRGQSLNLEVAVPAAKSVTLQLTRREAEQILTTPENREREFKWNGKPRPLHPVSTEDLIPIVSVVRFAE